MLGALMRYQTTCDHCGQHDDHPKLHYGEKTYHHDCTPAPVKEEILSGVHSESAEITAAIFQAAEDGVHGDMLLAKIEELHS